MIELMTWAARWGVPLEAVRDLEARMGLEPTEPNPMVGKSEAAVQAQGRLAAPHLGGRLFRNNVGALMDSRGVPVRYGLCNDSAAMNAQLKSSDLIGLYPLRITPEHVGHIVGQFWAVECKEGDWRYSGTDHEKAQLAFGQLVAKFGGRFQFYSGGDLT